jgi:hypothetical protein
MKAKLWIVGCSISHGVGVDPDQRWGVLAAEQLQLEPKFLTAEGSSIEWAADQILQAPIQSIDTVLWGLTTPNRSMWYDDNGQVHHILNVYYQNHLGFDQILDRRHLVQLNLAYKAVNYVRQVQTYLQNIGCKFAIASLLPGLDEHRQIMLDRLIDAAGFFVAYDHDASSASPSPTEFLKLTRPSHNIFVDVGSDGFHPGPQQHKLYCNKFLNKLQSST